MFSFGKMNHKFITSWSMAIILLVLTILLGDHIQANSLSDHHHHHHMDNDQSTLVFFTLDDLKQGKTLPIYFRGNQNPTKSPQFLPRDEADSIPFSESKLDYLLNYFGFARGTPQAKAMENTLTECQVKPIKGETKLCATSLESMLDFVHEMLGGRTTQIRALNTRNLDISSVNVLKNYSIVSEPREVVAPKMVACHTMPYPYMIYYCHYQKSESRVFRVSLQVESSNKEEGEGVEAVAVCHMDTSQWSESHVSFKVLGVKAGSCPVCHFFPADNLVWVPMPLSKTTTSVTNQVSSI